MYGTHESVQTVLVNVVIEKNNFYLYINDSKKNVAKLSYKFLNFQHWGHSEVRILAECSIVM